MAARARVRQNTQTVEPHGRWPFFWVKNSTIDFYHDGDRLVCVSDPYTFPTFYWLGDCENGELRVTDVESYEYPTEPWEDDTFLRSQIQRVYELVPIDDSDKALVNKCTHAIDHYLSCDSPEAKARAAKRWAEASAEADKVLAEIERKRRGGKPEMPEKGQVERKQRKHGLGLFFGLTGN